MVEEQVAVETAATAKVEAEMAAVATVTEPGAERGSGVTG